jgi:hypothetical protein
VAFGGENQPMPQNRRPLLSPQAIHGLEHAKQQILDAAVGRIPEPLVQATTRVAVQLAQSESLPTEGTEKALHLAREILQCLAREKWKPDTALKLKRRHQGGEREVPE